MVLKALVLEGLGCLYRLKQFAIQTRPTPWRCLLHAFSIHFNRPQLVSCVPALGLDSKKHMRGLQRPSCLLLSTSSFGVAMNELIWHLQPCYKPHVPGKRELGMVPETHANTACYIILKLTLNWHIIHNLLYLSYNFNFTLISKFGRLEVYEERGPCDSGIDASGINRIVVVIWVPSWSYSNIGFLA